MQALTLGETLESLESAGSAPSRSSVAYEQILDALVAGKLPGGSIIQERLLARLLNLSRTPVREAISRLEGEGLLQRISPRVMMVNRVTVSEVLEILAVRRLLEVEAVGLATGHMTEEETAGLIGRVEALLAAQTVTAEAYHLLDDDIHEGIARAGGNQTLRAIVVDLRRKTAMFDLRRVPERFRPSCEEHLAILRAIRMGDSAAAQTEIARHIGNVRQSILRRLSVGPEQVADRSGARL
jgi:DNA-binding GntR family transcriptional regulator